MSDHDFNSLRTRVETTAERLAAAQADRRQRNQSLLDTLARLEDKFAAQEQELAYYRQRVAPLEAATSQLCELTARLLDMVDAGFDRLDDPDDGVQRAIAVAAAMLEREAGMRSMAGEADEPRDSTVVADGNAMPDVESVADLAEGAGLDDESAAERDATDFLAPATGFVDVAAEVLAAEAAADQDLADMPETVRAACNAAIVDMLDAGLPAPLPDPVAAADGDAAQSDAAEDSVQPSADDIRTLLKRVEAAAAQVNAARAGAPAAPEPATPSGRSSGVAA